VFYDKYTGTVGDINDIARTQLPGDVIEMGDTQNLHSADESHEWSFHIDESYLIAYLKAVTMVLAYNHRPVAWQIQKQSQTRSLGFTTPMLVPAVTIE
jgi:hypothetical protein